MPQYYDDDDMDTDLQDEVPEFRDEAEFDDYLNDEEYQLMSEMFPRAKKELADYVGWDNLSVKVTIFDHEFNFDEAMIELKRSLKKKKTEGMYNKNRKFSTTVITYSLRSYSLFLLIGLSKEGVDCFPKIEDLGRAFICRLFFEVYY